MLSHRVRESLVGLCSLSVTTALAVGLAACGGSTAAQSQDDSGAAAVDGSAVDTGIAVEDSGATRDASGSRDAGADAGADADAAGNDAAVAYPAFALDVPTIQNNGEAVLSAPVFVTVTWAGDANATTFNTFGDQIGPSDYWKTINSEYGVGASTSGPTNHVSISTEGGFPATLSDSDVDNLVAQNVANGTWPAPTRNTVYVVYLPKSTTFTFGGLDAGGVDACQTGVGGYHTQTTAGANQVAYAVVPQCPSFQLNDIILSASHEMNEAATDPYPNSQNNGYQGFNDLSWEFFNFFQDELGDACEMYSWAAVTTTEPNFAYNVQRQWSNKASLAGHEPCVPALAEPMYNTTFLHQGDAGVSTQLDTITANLSPMGQGYPSSVPGRGFKVALNQSVTFPIGLYSDQPTSAPWTLDVWGATNPIGQDQNGNPINNGTATVTFSKSTGQNGDIVDVTVTPTAYSTLNVTLVTIRSVLPGATAHHYLPILIAPN